MGKAWHPRGRSFIWNITIIDDDHNSAEHSLKIHISPFMFYMCLKNDEAP